MFRNSLRPYPRPCCHILTWTSMSTVQLSKIVKILVVTNASYLHLNSSNCPPTYRSLSLSAHGPSRVIFLSVSLSVILSIPTKSKSPINKFPTIPNCQVRGFQNQLELSPFLHPLNLESVRVLSDNSPTLPLHS